MQSLRETCIVCKTSKNLDTVMTVTVDDKKYEVSLCAEHAEETTPKQVKDKVRERITEIEEVLKKVKELGLTDMLVGSAPKIIIAETPKETTPEPQPDTQPDPQPESQPKVTIVKKQVEKPTEKSEAPQITRIKRISKEKGLSKVKSVGGVAMSRAGTSANLESLESLDASAIASEIAEEKGGSVPQIKEIDYQVVAGRGGQAMRLPRNIKQTDGTTMIQMVDTGGDRTIQERFRELSAGNFSHKKEGYDVMNCSLCRGSGFARTGQTCPKCGGTGLLNKGHG